jgi:hypothetical protein
MAGGGWLSSRAIAASLELTARVDLFPRNPDHDRCSVKQLYGMDGCDGVNAEAAFISRGRAGRVPPSNSADRPDRFRQDAAGADAGAQSADRAINYYRNGGWGPARKQSILVVEIRALRLWDVANPDEVGFWASCFIANFGCVWILARAGAPRRRGRLRRARRACLKSR